MTGLIAKLIINALALFITTQLVPGLYLADLSSTIWATLIWGLVNALIRPIVSLLTLPLQFLSLGIFTLVINALMLFLTSSLVDGFMITGFWSAFFGAIILSLLSTVLTQLFNK